MDRGVNPDYLDRHFRSWESKAVDRRSCDSLLVGHKKDRQAREDALRRDLEEFQMVQAARPLKPPGKR